MDMSSLFPSDNVAGEMLQDQMTHVSFRAGLLNHEKLTKETTADPRKGLFQIITSEEDGLSHLQWKPHDGTSVEQDLIMINGEIEMLKVTSCAPSDRVYVLKWHDSDMRMFLWMQEKDESKDPTNASLVNSILENGANSQQQLQSLDEEAADDEAPEIPAAPEVPVASRALRAPEAPEATVAEATRARIPEMTEETETVNLAAAIRNVLGTTAEAPEATSTRTAGAGMAEETGPINLAAAIRNVLGTTSEAPEATSTRTAGAGMAEETGPINLATAIRNVLGTTSEAPEATNTRTAGAGMAEEAGPVNLATAIRNVLGTTAEAPEATSTRTAGAGMAEEAGPVNLATAIRNVLGTTSEAPEATSTRTADVEMAEEAGPVNLVAAIRNILATNASSAPRGAITSSAPRGAITSSAPRGAITSSAPRGAITSSAPRGAITSSAPRGAITLDQIRAALPPRRGQGTADEMHAQHEVMATMPTPLDLMHAETVLQILLEHREVRERLPKLLAEHAPPDDGDVDSLAGVLQSTPFRSQAAALSQALNTPQAGEILRSFGLPQPDGGPGAFGVKAFLDALLQLQRDADRDRRRKD